ncbi:protein S100-A9-like [Elgaria multicarinata webbii]|uniref:protein S100-A9-like n=1 Tax=Elgaria multicarinata webbii TaxID=159646 RepID=UPI002FCD1AC8
MSQTQLEEACETIINVFHQYSLRDGNSLSEMEMAELMKKELPNFLKEKKNPKAIDEMFNDLDKNKDAVLSFDEFLVLVQRVLFSANEHNS